MPRKSELLRLRAGSRMVRIHPLAGPHPCRWNEFRGFGPTRSRFDHQTMPRRVQDREVAYLAVGANALTAAVAEYFQDESGVGVRPIDPRRDDPNMVVFDLASDLTLLDLDTGWITRAGGNQAIRTGPRGTARAWARMIHAHHQGAVQGLAYSSSVWGPGRCVVLWERAQVAFPDRPLVTRLLRDPSMSSAVAAAAAALGTYVL